MKLIEGDYYGFHSLTEIDEGITSNSSSDSDYSMDNVYRD